LAGNTRFHAITAKTPEHLIFDAGVVYKNFVDLSNFGEEMGATRGGSEWNAGIEKRNIEVDGIPGPTKGFTRIVRVEPTMTINLLSLNSQNLKDSIPGAKLEDGEEGFENYKKLTIKQITDDDYIDNIALIARTGSGRMAIFVIENVLADGGFGISFVDQDESNPAVTFQAHFDPAKLEAVDDPMDAIPAYIIYPDEIAAP